MSVLLYSTDNMSGPINRRIQEICLVTHEWLHKEQSARLQHEFISPTRARMRENEILGQELPVVWDAFRRFRAINKIENDSGTIRRLELNSNHKLLKACAIGQIAFAWHDLPNTKDARVSLLTSFKAIRAYMDELKINTASLPDLHLLDEPIKTAVDNYSGIQGAYSDIRFTLQALVGFTIQGLSEQTGTQLIVPQPGLGPRVVVQWDI